MLLQLMYFIYFSYLNTFREIDFFILVVYFH